MEKNAYAEHLRDIAKIDESIRRAAEKLREEGYEFELEFPEENMVVLKTGGREFNFTKLKNYEASGPDGAVSFRPIEEVIAEEIRSSGK